ncbi:MAG: outer membrane beta-barrel protein [Epsilonproteobacteria bacterium]|nr:outer membrane beta-barrel protein [Campylobacterota bacterium]
MLNRIITLSAIALLMQSVAMAGGDIAPVEKPIVSLPLVHDNNGLYLGLGLSSMNLDNDLSKESFSATGIMLQAGYQVNDYLAVEGRYTIHLGNLKYDHGDTTNPNYSDYPGDFSNVGIYLKPMYRIENFSLYGLLGYGEVSLTDLPYPDNEGSVDRA